MTKEFSGHLAFVTGGARGIGLQICQDLAAEGASVVVADIHFKTVSDVVAALPTGDGGSHLAIQCDVSKKSDVEAALAEIIKTYGRPADLIVNNAGIGEMKDILDTEEEYFDEVMNVNFKGTFLVTQVFGKALLELNLPGSIVNLSSILAYSSTASCSVYSASKAAVMQFTKVAAREWGPKGIRLNVLHPGLIETAMTAPLKNTPAWSNYTEASSLRRIGKPKDISNVVLFVLSKKSGFVTGTSIEVSGQGTLG